ncbi:DNAJC24 isoform 6, partial [Pan troglodytes]
SANISDLKQKYQKLILMVIGLFPPLFGVHTWKDASVTGKFL